MPALCRGVHVRRPGRKRTPESIERRIAAINEELPAGSPMRNLELVQEKINLAADLASACADVDLSELETVFVAAAGPYSERKGIRYPTWRAVGASP